MKKQVITAALTLGILATGFSNNQASAHELTYKVQSGDTLWKISTNHNISTQDLMKYNNLSSSIIYVGQELSLLAPHLHHTVPTYTVKSGDSLYLIARIHGTTVTDLKSINQLTSDLIKIGQVLKIPNESSSALTTNSKSYTVQSGDNLYGIANKTKLTVNQLKSFNNLSSNTIHVGQVLKLTSAGTSAPSPVAEKTFNADALIAEGKKYIGVPYVWGGNTPSGFDCSGFLKYVFNKQGITIPRTVATIWDAAKPVSSPQKGDLVFFTTYAPGASHAGIYLGDNKFLHASTSQGVTISDMNNSYWKPRYLGAKSIN